MIDTAKPVDALPLFNLTQFVKPNIHESFSFIFNHNIDFITGLYDSGKMRDVTYDNILHTILCGSVYLGYDLYECPNCGRETIIPHTCKSRFCSKCGVKTSAQRAETVKAMAFNTKHRHLVFTIPDDLRIFFLRDRSLLEVLFTVARNTLASVFNDRKFRKNKRKAANGAKIREHKSKYLYKDTKDNIVFGAVASLHTFGRDLKWNPHIHMLVCEDALDTANNKLKNFSYMSYTKLRKTWQYLLLDALDKKIGDNKTFKRLKNKYYRKYDKGFYVYAKQPKDTQDDDDISKAVAYITRYANRPIMAESRIVEYNPQTKMVHWFYNDHRDEQRVDVTEHAEEFIKKVTLHCPEANFKMVRFYGFYANSAVVKYNMMAELIGHKKKKEVILKKERQAIAKREKQKTLYRYNMIQSFQRDPLMCKCGEVMTYLESYNPFEGGKKNDIRYKEKCVYDAKYLKSRTRPPRQ